jgi:hypothetical protein
MDTLFEMGVLRDGSILLVSNRPLPKPLLRVEYYREMKLFKLIYDDGTDDGDMIEYELADHAAELVKQSTRNIVVVNAQNLDDPEGFEVPLVQVGL